MAENPRNNMWKMLARSIVTNFNSSHLQKILVMIQNNLTFEDPGLFSLHLTRHEDKRMKEEVANTWLINQLIHLLSSSEDERLTEKNVSLQKEILSACLLKQPWLFRRLMRRYIKLLKGACSRLDDSVEYNAFCMSDPPLGFLDQKCKFEAVKVPCSRTQNRIIENVVNVVAHTMNIAKDLYNELCLECQECILGVFSKMTLSIKRQCISFFMLTSSSTTCYNDENIKHLFLMLEGFETIVKNTGFYIESNTIPKKEIEDLIRDIGKVFETLPEFMEKSYGFPRSYFMHNALSVLLATFKAQTQSVSLVLNDLQVKIAQFLIENIIYWNNLSVQISKLLEDLFNNHISLCNAPEIFAFCVLMDVVSSKPNEFIIKKSVTDFKTEMKKVLQSFEACEGSSGIDFESKLKKLSNLLHIKAIVSHNYNLWHQVTHIKSANSCKVCEFNKNSVGCDLITKSPVQISDPIPLDGELFSSFIELVRKSTSISLDNYCSVAEIACGMLQFADFSQTNELQNFLMNFISKPLQNSYRLDLNSAQTLNIENVDNDFQETLELKCLSLLFNINTQHITPSNMLQLKKIVSKVIKTGRPTNVFRALVINSMFNLVLSNVVSADMIQNFIVTNFLAISKPNSTICEKVCNFFCLLHNSCYVVTTQKTFQISYKILCFKCYGDLQSSQDEKTFLKLLQKHSGIYTLSEANFSIDKRPFQHIFINYVKKYPLNSCRMLAPFINHSNHDHVLREWPEFLKYNELYPPKFYSDQTKLLVKSFPTNITCLEKQDLDEMMEKLVRLVYQSLSASNTELQINVIEAVYTVSTAIGIPENLLIHLLKMMFLFAVRHESSSYFYAILCTSEICSIHGITARNILHWHKHDIFKFLITLCASLFLRNGIGINKGLNNISKLFGYLGPREFITKHYKLISTMLLSWCVKYPACKELFQELAVVTQREVPTILRSSFLTAYSYLLLRDSNDTDSECVNFLVKQTGDTLYELLNSDIKRTVAEILIYYHKNPRGVMLAFRTLFHKSDKSMQQEVPHSMIVDYITKRFLGVLTFFETCLVDPDFEKNLKYDALLSLGEIIRFMGSKHITPFRFKILAMLKTAQTIDELKTNNVCLSLWNIFIHTVDIQTLGPLLSTILVSLEQLLQLNPKEVNVMLKFLILSNGSLLSVHIPDLYFIENMAVDQDIKSFVKSQIEKTRKNDSFLEQLKFYLRQIRHENIAVRVHGLRYLTDLFRKNRNNLNNLILEQKDFNSTLDTVIETLMIGSKHIDKQLQLASAKCLAEFGAIEPSHLPPNYAPQSNFALSIHTDSFAIMALQELCRAYQFQKDTKYVDSFSLAIQEILLARGVCPKLKKKMEVWESIPEHMRQLMEPLLTSCYTSLRMNTNIPSYPIFGSSSSQTCEEWGFNWASAMIATINDEETQNLLHSFKPSIKRDTNMLLVFLPYIILHALQCGNMEINERIYEELRYVFESTIQKQNISEVVSRRESIRGLKTLQFLPSTISNSKEEMKEDVEIKCAKVGFKLLDFLDCWLREWHKEYVGHSPDLKYTVIEKFLKRFDKKFVAKSNYECGEFARALMYLEAFIEGNLKSLLQENIPFLARIYAELSDPDSFEGAIGLKNTELTLSEQILANNVTENFLDSAACFEKLLQSDNLSTNEVNDIVHYYLLLDNPQIALLISEGILNKLGDTCMDACLKEVQAEPLWRLCEFDELEKLLETSDYNASSNWGIQCGQALLSFRNDELPQFSSEIERIQTNILRVLKTGGIERNSYGKSYPQIMKLHLICEIEKAKHLLNEVLTINTPQKCQFIFNEFLEDWKLRLAIMQPTPKILEPVLCLRRILLMEITKILSNRGQSSTNSICDIINNEVGEMWLKSSELARNLGLYQRAQLYIMNAEQYQVKNLALEKAKLFWEKGDQTNCFKVIEQKIEEITTYARSLTSDDSIPKEMRTLYADMKFFQAACNAESMNVRTDVNIQLFKDSIKANQKSEKCLVYFAQYMEKIYNSSSDEHQNNQGMETLLDVIVLYGKSMSFGCEFIYQSMPRMLSIWFDFTTKQKKDNYFRKIMLKMNENIEKFSKTLPLFVFFTAFSQLTSRICHPSIEVYHVLKGIIVRLIEKFPQQSLWMLLSIFKSSYVGRVKRCMEIFNDRALSSREMQKLISDFNSLAEKLIELTNKEIPQTQKNPTVSSLVRSLPKLFTDPNFSKVIMPFEDYMQPVLPPINERNNPAHTFDAFPKKPIFINGVEEKITILMSLQKPRKVSLLGDDGKNYTVMMKPKDDLRKDFRLMEFNAVVKQQLHQNPEARHRRLCIRTYAVVPLNEECGLIEWVHNLHAFRQILMSFYRRRNQAMSAKELRQCACATNDPIEKKREVFLRQLLPKHPPVFGEWFRQCFTTPHNWYQARTAYIRTTAVMSIVGYVLGLGDRHGENILFDGTNGDTVHVDFNCLFNKGESFDYPEKVPFRLTHNMVQAMGPLKVEGPYRKCCEITMKVLKTQISTLMSILRPFVYDPLVSWNRAYKTDGLQERTDSKAMENVRHIEERLKGFVKIGGNISNMPLSTEGQVNFVITEATDIDNLAAMYIGWAPYM